MEEEKCVSQVQAVGCCYLFKISSDENRKAGAQKMSGRGTD
jgi:hypothetical protein